HKLSPGHTVAVHPYPACRRSLRAASINPNPAIPLLMSTSYFPRWRRVDGKSPDGVVQPDEYLGWGQNIAMGAQHVVAMFGSTILAPLLMGFDPNVAILMSGIGTLIFFVFVRGQVPSYLGSSFAFIGGVIAVTGYAGSGP